MRQTIAIRVSRHSIPVYTDDVNGDCLAQLVDELGKVRGRNVTVTVRNFDAWPPEAQQALWSVCRAVGEAKRKLRLIIDGQKCASPVSATVARLVGSDDVGQYERRLCSALHAAACCHSEIAYDAAATEIVDRLRDLGVGVRKDAIVRQIRAIASPRQVATEGPNPTILAQEFVASLPPPSDCDTQAEQRVLHYFQGSFYHWREPWQEIGHQELHALAAQHLQNNSNVDEVTSRLVNDVVTNLAGMCVVARGDEPLPFLLEDYGSPAAIRRPQILLFSNGMLDLGPLIEGGPLKLQPFDTRWFSTVKLPYRYEPKAKCPRFRAFLRRILEIHPRTKQPLRHGDQREQLLQEFFGYTLLNDGRFQRFLIMFGDGANGKSVVQHLWTAMLGRENVSHISLDQLGSNFALEPLLGKVANICGDLNEIDGVAEGILKLLTGSDNLTVHRKYKTSITMAPSLKLIFATNALPRFHDKSQGVWRRLIAMPFDVTIPMEQQDDTLAQALEVELPGILNWAIRGLQRLLQHECFSECAVCSAAKHQHRFDCSPFEQFSDECLIGVPSAHITKDALYQVYQTWCKANGRKEMSSNELSRLVLKLPGVEKRRETSGSHRGYCFSGVGDVTKCIIPDAGDAEPDALADDE